MNSTLSLALLLAAARGTLSVATVTAPTRPNILMMLVDDMGYSDVAAFGATNVSTPHIDALIRRGVKMTQWISAAPICTPSRASLQTGRYPIRTGCMGNVERYRVILSPSNIGGLDPTKHTSIATALKTAGYATGMSGKVKLPRPPLDTLCPTRTAVPTTTLLLNTAFIGSQPPTVYLEQCRPFVRSPLPLLAPLRPPPLLRTLVAPRYQQQHAVPRTRPQVHADLARVRHLPRRAMDQRPDVRYGQ